MKDKISEAVIRRLPRYYRFLDELEQQKITRISSHKLAKIMGANASQIRQDLNNFGGFGQQGYGYNVVELKAEIAEILGVTDRKKCIIIGAGNMGRTIATHMDFNNKGFTLVGIFDSKESYVGQLVAGLPIRSDKNLDDFCRNEKPEAAIICVPKNAAKSVGEQLIKLGIKGIWNFSHYDFRLENQDIVVENVHLGDSLMTLRYNIKD
ncbi:MAG: redox-sensing transcriptional repressor Rex [Acutalibacteraceae bacterium]|nr:redox-sensing transcriptional repressor Rex [Acutalibacteraceae bacterium]